MPPQESPSNSTPAFLQFSISHLLTLLSHFNALLDFFFATHLLHDSNPSRTGTGFGVGLIVGTLAALLIDLLAKREMMRVASNPDQWHRIALLAAGSMFSFEDCTMIMAIAHVEGSYDATDRLNVATVTVSLLFGFTSIVAGMLRLVWLIGQFHPERFDWYRLILICMWIGSTSFFSVLLILILVDADDDDSWVQGGSTLIGAAWVVYVLQLFAALVFTTMFLQSVCCGKW